MSYRPLRGVATPAHFYPEQGNPGLTMAEIEAGIVAGGQIYSQQPATGKFNASLSTPATWTYIWVGIAVLYLIGIYIGAIRIAGRS